MIKNADTDKYFYFGYGVRFDTRKRFSLLDGSGFCKNIMIFGVDNSFFVHTDYRKKDILTPDKGPTNGLNDTKLTAEVEYSINFTE